MSDRNINKSWSYLQRGRLIEQPASQPKSFLLWKNDIAFESDLSDDGAHL